jgi:cytochrome c553
MIDNLGSFIINGPATSRGMPDFAGKLSDDDVQKLRAFILAMADAVRPGLPAEKAGKRRRRKTDHVQTRAPGPSLLP